MHQRPKLRKLSIECVLPLAYWNQLQDVRQRHTSCRNSVLGLLLYKTNQQQCFLWPIASMWFVQNSFCDRFLSHNCVVHGSLVRDVSQMIVIWVIFRLPLLNSLDLHLTSVYSNTSSSCSTVASSKMSMAVDGICNGGRTASITGTRGWQSCDWNLHTLIGLGFTVWWTVSFSTTAFLTE